MRLRIQEARGRRRGRGACRLLLRSFPAKSLALTPVSVFASLPLKHPLWHAMAQLPDSAAMLSWSLALTPFHCYSLPRLAQGERQLLRLSCSLIPSLQTTRKLLRYTYSNSGVPSIYALPAFPRWNSSWNVILWLAALSSLFSAKLRFESRYTRRSCRGRYISFRVFHFRL